MRWNKQPLLIESKCLTTNWFASPDLQFKRVKRRIILQRFNIWCRKTSWHLHNTTMHARHPIAARYAVDKLQCKCKSRIIMAFTDEIVGRLAYHWPQVRDRNHMRGSSGDLWPSAACCIKFAFGFWKPQHKWHDVDTMGRRRLGGARDRGQRIRADIASKCVPIIGWWTVYLNFDHLCVVSFYLAQSNGHVFAHHDHSGGLTVIKDALRLEALFYSVLMTGISAGPVDTRGCTFSLNCVTSTSVMTQIKVLGCLFKRFYQQTELIIWWFWIVAFFGRKLAIWLQRDEAWHQQTISDMSKDTSHWFDKIEANRFVWPDKGQSQKPFWKGLVSMGSLRVLLYHFEIDIVLIAFHRQDTCWPLLSPAKVFSCIFIFCWMKSLQCAPST